ncbi:MAG: hypothetical protein HC934_02135 [Acaryochloridaceae cyanobacterium SU_2_1]|nr:hypothetical protein [Acaryochloridaceae cyanobacterium SU_2_1]
MPATEFQPPLLAHQTFNPNTNPDVAHAPVYSPSLTTGAGTPPSLTLGQANQHIKNAWIAGIVTSVLTLVVAFSAGEQGGFLLIDVVLAAGLSFGIYKKNRASALIMLIYFAISKILQLSAAFNPLALLFGIVFLYLYAQGVRGTFAHHALTQSR